MNHRFTSALPLPESVRECPPCSYRKGPVNDTNKGRMVSLLIPPSSMQTGIGGSPRTVAEEAAPVRPGSGSGSGPRAGGPSDRTSHQCVCTAEETHGLRSRDTNTLADGPGRVGPCAFTSRPFLPSGTGTVRPHPRTPPQTPQDT